MNSLRAKSLMWVLALGMAWGCGGAPPEGEVTGDEAGVEQESSPPSSADPYADSVVPGWTSLVLGARHAVGAPDGKAATVFSLFDSALTLDMGSGEEGTGDLRVYYRGLEVGVVAKVDFLRDDGRVIASSQLRLVDPGVGTHIAVAPFSASTPYRYVRLRGTLVALYAVDAVEAKSLVAGLVCGDGVVGREELCDDGNILSGDGCDSVCQVEQGSTCEGEPSVCTDIDECANGTAACLPGETCINLPGSYGCMPPVDVCGDGQVGSGEQCDDGNVWWADGCDGNCQVESGYTCEGSPSICMDIDECVVGTTACLPWEVCVNTPGSYTCEPAFCPAPYTVCGDQCVDLTVDLAHCGGCFSACEAYQSCVNSVCVGDGGGDQPP